MLNKEERKQRFLAQEAKAKEMLRTDNLCDFIDGLKYAYSFCLRYKKNLKEFIMLECFGPFEEIKYLSGCLQDRILTPWKDTYYFDKTKAENLQQYIWEHSTN